MTRITPLILASLVVGSASFSFARECVLFNAYGAPTSVHVGLGVPAKQPPAAAANFRPGEYNFASSFASRFAAPADAKPSVFGRR